VTSPGSSFQSLAAATGNAQSPTVTSRVGRTSKASVADEKIFCSVSHHDYTNLLEFLEFVTNYIHPGYPIAVIYLDFREAFDMVPHKRLMININAMGITRDVFNWIKDWLNDREQSCSFGESF